MSPRVSVGWEETVTERGACVRNRLVEWVRFGSMLKVDLLGGLKSKRSVELLRRQSSQ